MLGYWRDRCNIFGDLVKMACDVLNIPITTVASESAFSIGSRVLSIEVLCWMKQLKLSYSHVIGWLVLLVRLTFFIKDL